MRRTYSLYIIKLYLLRNNIVQALSLSKLKVGVIVTFMLGFTVGLFLLFSEMFSFLDSLEPTIAAIIIDRLMYLFYFAVFIMLILSSALVSFSTIYKSREISFLLSKPIEYRKIFSLKFYETAVLSSWAFLFVVGPFAFSYGIFTHAGLSYYCVFCLLLPFLLLIGASAGTIIITLIVRWCTPRRLKWIIILCVIGGIIFSSIYYIRLRTVVFQERENIVFALNSLIPHFRYCQYPLLPSYWFCESLLSASKGYFPNAIFYILVLLSNGLFFTYFSQILGENIFYKGWLRVESSDNKKEYPLRKSIIGRIFYPLRRFTSPIRYAFFIKDLKVFWREPIQWLQFVIFFGLLGIYFSNLNNFSYNILRPIMKQFTSLCNVSAMMLVMTSLTVRFIYPQISLEGKRFWLIGLAPIRIKTIFFQKYWVSLLWASMLSLGLMILSNMKLEIDPFFAYFSYGTVFFMSVTLVSMGCGFGALFPNFKEDNPARLVAGFGGTLLFILSLAYVSLVIFILAWSFSIYFSGNNFISKFIINRLFLSGFLIFIISVVSGGLPIILGIRALQRMEF